MYEVAEKYLKQMLGEQSSFRLGQWEAIEYSLQNKKALIVQQTGWGKSIVYFIATRILRDKGKGPTILISPLLSLIRNQIENASKIGIVALTINSQNVEEWDNVKSNLKNDTCDILLISPEQLANKERLAELLSYIKKGIGMFVIDEAHCISDWGHDFRPDYRRIISIVSKLPPNVPVIATTATANQRVIDDIVKQLGDIEVLRGPLLRESLRLQTIKLKDQAERMAWLAENIPNLPGVGIIYCLTVSDCNKLSKWLNVNGINARPYTASVDTSKKILLENAFMENKIKCLVATVALGMGYDKADIGFVVHFQRPGNVVSYYQQIGRAGRQLDNAYAILLNGAEDDQIQEYFIKSAFPTEIEMKEVVKVVEGSKHGLNKREILRYVNIRYGRLEKCLKFLEVENTIVKAENSKYFRTINPWVPNNQKSEVVTQRRYEELSNMQEFVGLNSCYMKFIAQKLDDPSAKDCGKCSNCTGSDFFSKNVDPKLVLQAIKFLKKEYIEIEKRKLWADGKKIAMSEQLEDGRALCAFGDAGWGKFIHEDKYVNNYFREELVDASVELLLQWIPDIVKKMHITFVPSLSRPDLVKSFAQRIASKLNIPCVDLIKKKAATLPQKELENSAFQCYNALKGFEVVEVSINRDILLIDDMVDSKWTLTVCGSMLREKGSARVYPFAIASTAGMRGAE